MSETLPSKTLANLESRPLARSPPENPFGSPIVVPSLVADAGDLAAKRFANFFGSINNDNTRAAYQRACLCFFDWVDQNGIPELVAIEPFHVGAYLKAIAPRFSKPTVKQHLAAIRMLFDYLVTGQIMAINPAHAVHGPKHVVKRGKTPVLAGGEARELIDSIETSSIIGLRDRALIGVMTFAFARVGAAVAMRVEDFYAEGKRFYVRLHEKGGKRHEMPVHHTLDRYLEDYIAAAGIGADAKGALFRTAAKRSGLLTKTPMSRVDVYRMIRARAVKAGVAPKIGCHTFRATGITAYMEAGGTLEKAQVMAAHESPRTTKLYDRTSDAVTLDEVERIRI